MSTNPVANDRAYYTEDKSGWGDGPWQNEPDKMQFKDAATGYDCLIVRGPSGALCGYVGVPEGHDGFGASYTDVDVEVHGGLTFSGRCQEGDESHGICHVSDNEVWWFGFDCAHWRDISPKTNALLRSRGHEKLSMEDHAIYRDEAYVREQIAQLALQLAPKQLPKEET